MEVSSDNRGDRSENVSENQRPNYGLKELKVAANPRFMNMRGSAEDGSDLHASKFGKNRTLIEGFDNLNLNPDQGRESLQPNAIGQLNTSFGGKTPSLMEEPGLGERRSANSMLISNKIPTAQQERGGDNLGFARLE